MMAAFAFADVSHLSPGASRAFVSTDPTIVEARAAYKAGAFTRAAMLLSSAEVTDAAARDELTEVIRRMRREYNLDRAGLLIKLRESIPDVTDADLDRWMAAEQVQYRTIDGQIWFFRREPGHILLFCKEAIDRRDAHTALKPGASAPDSWTLEDHLKEIIASAANSATPEVLPLKTRVKYTLTVNANPRGAKSGSLLRVWLPFPQVYGRQRDAKLLRSNPDGATVAPPAIDGDPVSGVPQRTVYLERKIDDPSQPAKFEIEFEFITSAFYPKLDDTRPKPGASAPDRSRIDSSYLSQRPPHIVFTPELKAKANEIVGAETNPLIKARKIFIWLDENLRWTPEEEYCVIPNLSMHGLTRGKGDCGVASMTFITLCRIAGVPARWQSGWTTNPVGWNMHDWSEIYIEPWGWIPVDASYGRQKSDDPAVRDFYFGHTDSHRLIVSLDYGRELSPAKQSFRSEPLDFQRGEVELDGRNLYFDEWDYEIEFEREPVR